MVMMYSEQLGKVRCKRATASSLAQYDMIATPTRSGFEADVRELLTAFKWLLGMVRVQYMMPRCLRLSCLRKIPDFRRS